LIKVKSISAVVERDRVGFFPRGSYDPLVFCLNVHRPAKITDQGIIGAANKTAPDTFPRKPSGCCWPTFLEFPFDHLSLVVAVANNLGQPLPRLPAIKRMLKIRPQ